MTTDITWRTEQRKVSELIPYEKNPRKITPEQTEQLKRSLLKFNLAEIPVLNTDNKIVAGHQRIMVMKLLGREHETIDVRIPSRKLDQAEFKEYLLRSNKNTADWDWDVLFDDFGIEEMAEVGFSTTEINTKKRQRTLKKENDIPEVTRGITERGDIYQLGNHRIMCGDSTNPDDIKKLLEGLPSVAMIFTDPPYNVAYQGKGKNTKLKIQNDDMTDAAFQQFINQVFVNYGFFAPEAIMYCCYASTTHTAFETAILANGYDVRNQIIWVKKVASFGWGDYRWKHEPIFYAIPKGKKSNFYGDRKQYTTWEEEKTDEELLEMMKAMIKKDEDGQSTVWRFNRDTQYDHPTQKPVELIKKALGNSSKTGALVMDLFMGSGSTMIACEVMHRQAVGMEIEPHYCDVIAKRYVNLCRENNLPFTVLRNGKECHDFD